MHEDEVENSWYYIRSCNWCIYLLPTTTLICTIIVPQALKMNEERKKTVTEVTSDDYRKRTRYKQKNTQWYRYIWWEHDWTDYVGCDGHWSMCASTIWFECTMDIFSTEHQNIFLKMKLGKACKYRKYANGTFTVAKLNCATPKPIYPVRT